MQADKYTIAWFKIAECVSRGEKERALGVYRLLSHSFNDDAVARQLEADIYYACNEQEKAVELYRQAVDLYDKSQRFLEATAVLEHLVILVPNDKVLRYDLINYYGSLRNISKVGDVFNDVLLRMQGSNNHAAQIEKLVSLCAKAPDNACHIKMLEQLIMCLHRLDQYAAHMLPCLEQVLDICMQDGYENYIQEFFSTIHALDEDMYHYACAYVKK